MSKFYPLLGTAVVVIVVMYIVFHWDTLRTKVVGA